MLKNTLMPPRGSPQEESGANGCILSCSKRISPVPLGYALQFGADARCRSGAVHRLHEAPRWVMQKLCL